MPTSKTTTWLNTVDPYLIKRLALYKALFITTLMVYAFWLMRPNNLTAFVVPIFLMAFYEAPILKTYREKDFLFGFMSIALIVGGVSFYLLFPFKFYFLFYALAYFACVYYFVNKWFPSIKALTMLVVINAAIETGTTPAASLQIVFEMIFASCLSFAIIFVCFKKLPNKNTSIWLRALTKYIACLEQEIAMLLSSSPKTFLYEEVRHINMLRAYQSLIPKQHIMHAHRIGVCIRNLQFALDNSLTEQANDVFWHAVQKALQQYRIAIEKKRPITLQTIELNKPSALQKQVLHYLKTTSIHWNKLCKIL